MPIITYDIPNGKAIKLRDATKEVYAIPQIPDPEWEDPDDGSVAPSINEFTDDEWVKERGRRFFIDTVHTFEKREAIETAKNSITKDDQLAS